MRQDARKKRYESCIRDACPGVNSGDTQINIMNLGFAGFYGGANTGFKFRLAGVTRTDNAAQFNAGPGSPAEREMKQTLSRGAPRALNYYSTTAGAYLGWAYLPGLTPSRMYLDGIVVDWESMYTQEPLAWSVPAAAGDTDAATPMPTTATTSDHRRSLRPKDLLMYCLPLKERNTVQVDA